MDPTAMHVENLTRKFVLAPNAISGTPSKKAGAKSPCPFIYLGKSMLVNTVGFMYSMCWKLLCHYYRYFDQQFHLKLLKLI